MKKKAIVIGAGIGGLSIAARLLSNNYTVTIYEKNSSIGGKTNHLKHKDYNFDLTASLIMFYKDYIELFNYCNENYEDYFSIFPLKTIYKVFFSDNTSYEFSNHLNSLYNSLNLLNRYDSTTSKYLQFISDNYNKYLFTDKNFLSKNFTKKSSFFNPLELINALKLHPLCSAYSDCNNYISEEKLINTIMFQTMYIGISPYSKGSSIYNIIPAASQIEGLHYIPGGLYSYVKALEKLIIKKGGKIVTSTEVEEILFDKNKAIGVKIDDENHFSDIVIVNSDYTYTLKNLIKNKNIRNYSKPINDYNYSCSSFILYLGLNKKYPSLRVNNLYINNNNFKDNIESPFYGAIPIEPSLYIYCPSSVDNTICAKNHECINVTVRVPNLLYKNISWNHNTIKSLIDKILDILSTIDGLDDIREHIEFKTFITPKDLEKRYNTYAGCAFGLNHNLMQTNYFRPQCTIPEIDNLFFTGASIHPGNGVSMVLKSSKICMNEILKKST